MLGILPASIFCGRSCKKSFLSVSREILILNWLPLCFSYLVQVINLHGFISSLCLLSLHLSRSNPLCLVKDLLIILYICCCCMVLQPLLQTFFFQERCLGDQFSSLLDSNYFSILQDFYISASQNNWYCYRFIKWICPSVLVFFRIPTLMWLQLLSVFFSDQGCSTLLLNTP